MLHEISLCNFFAFFLDLDTFLEKFERICDLIELAFHEPKLLLKINRQTLQLFILNKIIVVLTHFLLVLNLTDFIIRFWKLLIELNKRFIYIWQVRLFLLRTLLVFFWFLVVSIVENVDFSVWEKLGWECFGFQKLAVWEEEYEVLLWDKVLPVD